jgi:hypothetical protein
VELPGGPCGWPPGCDALIRAVREWRGGSRAGMQGAYFAGEGRGNAGVRDIRRALRGDLVSNSATSAAQSCGAARDLLLWRELSSRRGELAPKSRGDRRRRRSGAPEPKEGQSLFRFAHRLGRVCRHREGKVAPRVHHARESDPPGRSPPASPSGADSVATWVARQDGPPAPRRGTLAPGGGAGPSPPRCGCRRPAPGRDPCQPRRFGAQRWKRPCADAETRCARLAAVQAASARGAA